MSVQYCIGTFVNARSAEISGSVVAGTIEGIMSKSYSGRALPVKKLEIPLLPNHVHYDTLR